MADEGKFPKILDDRMRAFFESAAAFIARLKADGKDPCHSITPESPEWMDWVDYFLRHVGSTPAVMQAVEAGSAPSVTVPAKQPEWFDPRYVPRHPAPRRSAILPRPADSFEQTQRMDRIKEANEAWDRLPPPGSGKTGFFRPLASSTRRAMSSPTPEEA
jgi:hypothetical protein